MRKRIAVIVMIYLFFGSVLHVSAEEKTKEELMLYARSAVLTDADSGRILYEKNARQVMPMASTTKILTCILALEHADLESYAQVSSYAQGMPKVKLGVQSGEYYKVKDLLYSLMLESHNDAAVVIAEHVAGSVEEFAELMNEKAAVLGCEDSFFITPNGLDAACVTENGESKCHATTAVDLARIMAYCIKESPEKDAFLEITRTPEYRFGAYKQNGDGFTENGRQFYCANHNAFLTMMDGALSGKTGFTNEAGYCYVGAVNRDGKTYIAVLLACGWPNNKSYKWTDMKTLMEYGLSSYEKALFSDVSVREEEIAPLYIKDAKSRKIGEEVYAPVSVRKYTGKKPESILLRAGEKIEVVKELEESLEAPIAAGTKVGVVRYLVDGKVYIEEELIITEEYEKIDWKWCLKQILFMYGLEV